MLTLVQAKNPKKYDKRIYRLKFSSNFRKDKYQQKYAVEINMTWQKNFINKTFRIK